MFYDITTISESPEPSFLSNQSKNTIRTIQQKMVIGFRNYAFALEAWSMLVCPAWLRIPRPGNIVNKGNSIYVAMHGPVSIGTRVYVDEKVYITALDSRLAHPLNGIRTICCDHRYSSSKFLSFEVSQPCVVYVCWDTHITHVPSWIQKKEYTLTEYIVTTNTGVYSVYSKIVPEAARVTMGGCRSKHSTSRNYFVLLGCSPDSARDGVKYETFCWWLRKEIPIALDIAGLGQTLIDDASSIDLSLEDDIDSVVVPCIEDRRVYYQYDANWSLSSLDIWFPENLQINYRPWLRLSDINGGLNCLQNHRDMLRYSRMDLFTASLSFTLSVETALASSYWKMTPSTALEYYIEPLVVSLSVEKPEGQSISSIDINTDRHLIVNASPSMMVMLADIADVTSRLREIDEVSATPRSSEKNQFPITQVVFHNNIGQHIRLKINNVAHDIDSPLGVDDEEDSFICNIPYSDHMIFRLPNTFEDSNPLASLRISLHTAGWSVVNNITLCPDEERLYSIDQLQALNPESSDSEDSAEDANNTWKTVTSRSAHEREFGTQTLRNHYHTYGLSPIPVAADQAVSTFTRLLDSTYDYEVSKDSPFAIVVRCHVTPLTQYREEYSMLTDGGNMFSDSNSSSDGGTPDETLSYALVVNFCTNLTFHNQSTGPVNINYEEDDDHVTSLVAHTASKPLPLSVFAKNGFDMRRMWGPQELIEHSTRITVLKANLNSTLSRRLRTSKEHTIENIRIDWEDIGGSHTCVDAAHRSLSIGSNGDTSGLGNCDAKSLESVRR